MSNVPAHYLSPLLGPKAEGHALVIRNRSAVLATHVEPAFESAARNRGLLGRTSLPHGHALVIAPCSSIHTFFMKFPIDVIYTRKTGEVMKIRRAVPAWRLSAGIGAFAVVEMAAGSAARAGLRVGDTLACERRPG